MSEEEGPGWPDRCPADRCPEGFLHLPNLSSSLTSVSPRDYWLENIPLSPLFPASLKKFPVKRDQTTRLTCPGNQIAPTLKCLQDTCPALSPFLRSTSQIGTYVPSLEISPDQRPRN